MELYAIGKLENFGQVFDVDYFHKHFDDYKEFIYSKSKGSNDKDSFYYDEIIKMIEKKS